MGSHDGICYYWLVKVNKTQLHVFFALAPECRDIVLKA